MTSIAAQAICLEDLLRSPVGPAGTVNAVIDGLDELTGTVACRLRRAAGATARGAAGAARTIRESASAGSATLPMANAERSDETLLAAYLDGDREAFAALVERYRTELHGFLARFLGSSAAADDVFQETFLQVHMAASTFDRTRVFKPWLFTIAANKARDWHRRQKRRRAASLDATIGNDADGARMVDLLPSGAEAPPVMLESSETRVRVKQVVDDMPALYREVLQLNYFQRMSYQQISEVLGVPLGTVKSRLHAAVATFADAWKASSKPAARRGAGSGKESTA
jgi:RNA polymerase sigma-70 factor (ECF subfamily)